MAIALHVGDPRRTMAMSEKRMMLRSGLSWPGLVRGMVVSMRSPVSFPVKVWPEMPSPEHLA